MSTKPQFKMYLEPDLVERLKQAATRFSRGSGQEIAEEILSIYLPTWIAVNDSMRRAVDFQTKLIAQQSERKVNGEIVRQTGGIKVAPRSAKGIPLINKAVDGRQSETSKKKKRA